MYSGDQNYNTSSSTTTPAATGLTPTSTSLTASSYAVVAGQTISLYTSVYSIGVASTMTGTVTYSAASQGVLGTANVSGGTATLTFNTLAPGTYNLTASYSGDSVFAASASMTSVIVTVTGKTVTLTGSLSPTTLYYGSDATLTAIASYPAGVIGGTGGNIAGDNLWHRRRNLYAGARPVCGNRQFRGCVHVCGSGSGYLYRDNQLSGG